MDIEQIRQQAGDENTAPEILIHLAKSEDNQTRQYVAANPNTPTETVLNLGAEFPRELLNNPIFNLLFLENPDFIDEIPIATLHSLIKQNNIPESFIIEYAERELDRDLLLKMIANLQVPRHVLEKLSTSSFPEVVEAAKLHINWAGEITKGWQELATEGFFREIENIRKTNTRIQIFNLLRRLTKLNLISNDVLKAFDVNGDLREITGIGITRKPYNLFPNDVPINLQKAAAKDINSKVRCHVANNPHTHRKILEKLADDIDRQVRCGVARNAKTPIKILRKLAKDTDEWVRRAVANNSQTPIKILRKLAKDTDEWVRGSVADNAKTPIKILRKLAKDKSVSVRCYIADNAKTPIKILKKLAKDNKEIRSTVACNPNTPIKVLKKLAEDKSSRVRINVAYHPNMPIKILDKLANCKNKDVHISIAENPNVPVYILDKLLNNDICYFFYTAMAIYPQKNPQGVSSIINRYLQKTPLQIERLILLLHPQASIISLSNRSQSIYWLERYSVTQNPNTPVEVIEKLTNDSNKVVRAAAKHNLDS